MSKTLARFVATAFFVSIMADTALLPAGTTAATQPADAVIQLTQQYCEMIHSGKGAKAVEKYWNFDAMFDAIFGDDMKRVTDENRAEMRTLMFSLVGHAYSNPKVNLQLAVATFEAYAAREVTEHRALVDYTIRLESGKALPNTLYWTQDGQGWHIMDATANGKPMTESIRAAYQGVSQKETPLQFVQEMAAGKN